MRPLGTIGSFLTWDFYALLYLVVLSMLIAWNSAEFEQPERSVERKSRLGWTGISLLRG